MKIVFALFFAFLMAAPAWAQEKDWEKRWNELVVAAKKEGKLNIYTSETRAGIIEEGVFQRRYPGIKVEWALVRGASGMRVLLERRSGNYLVDVLLGGGRFRRDLHRAKAFDPIKPALILPEVTDESKWWLSKHHYDDPEESYDFTYVAGPATVTISYNSQLVKPAELKSLRELLNPKWRGKMVTYDVRAGGQGGGTMRFIYHHPKLGPEFIRGLFAETDITLIREIRQAVDWLARGKFSICLVCDYTEVQRARGQGLPVGVLSFTVVEGVGGITAEGNHLSLMNRAPHPNAAKLFLNWLLSREGQITAQRALAQYGSNTVDSLRIDIPKGDIPAEFRRVEGVQYLNLQDPSRLDMTPIYKMITEALAERGKK